MLSVFRLKVLGFEMETNNADGLFCFLSFGGRGGANSEKINANDIPSTCAETASMRQFFFVIHPTRHVDDIRFAPARSHLSLQD
jgi:hypothetical protein